MEWKSWHDLTNPPSVAQRENIAIQRGKLEIDARRLALAEEEAAQELASMRERNEITAQYNQGRLELEGQRLQFDIQNANLTHLTAQEVAKIQAQSAERLAALNHANNLELAALNHAHNLEELEEKARLERSNAYGLLPLQVTQASLERGKAQNAAISQAMGEILRAKIQSRLDEKMELLKEANREKERSHEIKMAVLRSDLEKQGFTHEEITRLAVKLADPSRGELSEREKEMAKRYDLWKSF